ncbi:MAG: hypothetical protein ACYDEA_00150 [Candidatus Dormibacteria bacterium]
MSRDTWSVVGRAFSGLGAVLSIGGALFLCLVPTSYSPCPQSGQRIIGAFVAHCGTNSATLADVVGTGVYALLAVIPLVSLVPLASRRAWGPSAILSALIGGVIAYGFATWPSTGNGWWAFLPAAGALAVAAICAIGSRLRSAPG